MTSISLTPPSPTRPASASFSTNGSTAPVRALRAPALKDNGSGTETGLHDGTASHQRLDAITDHFRFQLDLEPEKPSVIQGENGVSQKAEGRGRASHYVSFPLLKVTGSVNAAKVTGTAWMDHEWFTEQLGSDQAGWDWFSVQLNNRTELMLFQLRRKDGTIDPYSSGTFIDAAGVAHHLRHDDFTLQPLALWNKYPVEWRIRVPGLHIDITSKAIVKDQELRGSARYWEGSVNYSGTASGVGYVEMTGYDKPIVF